MTIFKKLLGAPIVCDAHGENVFSYSSCFLCACILQFNIVCSSRLLFQPGAYSYRVLPFCLKLCARARAYLCAGIFTTYAYVVLVDEDINVSNFVPGLCSEC